MKKELSNSVGDLWRGVGFIGGDCFLADGVFNGYTKKQIADILKAKIRQKALAQ